RSCKLNSASSCRLTTRPSRGGRAEQQGVRAHASSRGGRKGQLTVMSPTCFAPIGTARRTCKSGAAAAPHQLESRGRCCAGRQERPERQSAMLCLQVTALFLQVFEKPPDE